MEIAKARHNSQSLNVLKLVMHNRRSVIEVSSIGFDAWLKMTSLVNHVLLQRRTDISPRILKDVGLDLNH